MLRTSATHGKTKEVKALVEHLVHERQEEPNLRLYAALILANVNPSEGSVTEVNALLEEMMEEGLSPDSGICHDIIKVGQPAPQYKTILT